MKTYEECLAEVQKDRVLWEVPENFRDYHLCLQAVKSSAWALVYVPKHLRDYEMCYLAVASEPRTISYVPNELVGREFLEILASA
jgi:hypothetical protein